MTEIATIDWFGRWGTSVFSENTAIFLNFFSSITTRLIESKFHLVPPWDDGTKVCSNGPGHITKMAIMPIYDKNILKNSSLERKGR